MLIFIIAILGALLFGILGSNLKIKFSFVKHDKDNNVIVSLTSPYGIFRHTKKISIADLIKGDRSIPAQNIAAGTAGKKGTPIDHDHPVRDMFDTKQIIDDYKKIYVRYEHYIKEKLVFDNIYWHTKVGTNDAAETAVLVGAIWAIKASVISFITRSYNIPNVSINVVPDYNIKTFETSIDCIFSIKLGYIVNANIKAILAQIKDGVKNE